MAKNDGETNMTPISDILDKIDQVMQNYVFHGYAALVQTLMPSILLTITAYIAFVGWSILQGWSSLSVGQLTKQVLKIGIAFSLATQWDVFSLYIYNLFTNGPNEISAVLMSSAGSSSSSVNAALQDSFNEGVKIASQLWDSGWTGKFVSIIVFFLNALVSGIAMMELAIAKCGLSVTLVLAPIFGLLLLWNSTKGLFDSWLRTAFGFALVPLFLSAVLLLIDQILQMSLDEMKNALQTSTGDKIEDIMCFILSSIISIGLLLKSYHFASQVANGIGLSGLESSSLGLDMMKQYSGYKSAKKMAVNYFRK